MKLIISIVQKKDRKKLEEALVKKGYGQLSLRVQEDFYHDIARIHLPNLRFDG